MYNINQGGNMNYGGGYAQYGIFDLLKELDIIVSRNIINGMQSDYDIGVEESRIIENPTKSIKVGEGTNRLVFKPAQSISEEALYQAGVVRSNYVYKIPWQLSIGSGDNIREALVPIFIESNKHLNQALQYLSLIVPKSYLLRELGINNIIMQEEVLTHNNMPRFANEFNKESAWKNYVMNSPQLTEQYIKLMDALDRHFVMSDMSFSMTPSNFGLKVVSGQEILVPLDLGHVIPKYGKIVKCPVCGSPMKYTHYADKEIHETRDVGLINKVETMNGYYRCQDINCVTANYSNSKLLSLQIDTTVFDAFMKHIKSDNELLAVESLLREI